ncbi:MAG TPA: Coenzyme F420 hydrogenase/dehydrogenase, beta subunit C-terminal domain [Candidatus Collinsella stercoripullorum]|nr:Coenzyme F420 hydrogenase/dehydrogenase, beta subunit C-terminal domain [Candidatus Collinsella stercoripullorum]
MMSTTPKLAESKVCTGCAACHAACGFRALEMRPDSEGFLRPYIDKDKCVGCGACERACPEVRPVGLHEVPPKVFACWDRDSARREAATSGGIFMRLAEIALDKGFWVCGAVFGENLSVCHVLTRDIETIKAMRGSKYVQSDVRDAMKDCLEVLRNGGSVLFSGTPCQVAAIKRVAGRRYAGNLFTLDVLCHGAPSPRFWRDYLDYREGQVGDIAVGARFRKKTPSWTVFSLELTFEAEHRSLTWCTVEDLYLRAFLGDYISRESCHSCRYVGAKRLGDITLADFWGYVSEDREARNDERGISLVMPNTAVGNQWLSEASDELVVVEKSLEEAIRGNVPLRRRIEGNANRSEFWHDYEEGGIKAVRNTYLAPIKRSFKHRVNLYFNNHAYLVPRKIRKKLLEVRARLIP